MTDKQRDTLLRSAMADLRKTDKGYRENPQGPNWENAFRKLNQLHADLAPPVPRLVFPIPGDQEGRVCQGLHETGGLPGNWAIDICCPARTSVVAVEKGTITRLSGSDPNTDRPDSSGVFGWTVYFQSPRGYVYFVTHLGWRPPELRPGLLVEPGDLIGKVGDQDYRPDHVHYGVGSPLGPADAKKRILAVGAAPRIR